MKEQIRSEFSRQAASMAAAPAFADANVLKGIIDALGSFQVGRVLDVACGPGFVAEAIAPIASEIVGIDVTPEMVALAEARLRKAGFTKAAFRTACAEKLPFGPAEFDTVVTRLSFHHFPDLPAVLAEIRRVLRSGGRLLVADVISSSDPEKSALHNALERLRDPTHVRMLPHPALVAALRSGGFEPCYEESWDQQRTFKEWVKIVAAPDRTEPLRYVMRALARAGLDAGIRLREMEGDLLFTHTWLILIAEPTFAAGV
ncbi:MAG: class I SAM-dependent methyltransferase [Pseudomonadota bacterium]